MTGISLHEALRVAERGSHERMTFTPSDAHPRSSSDPVLAWLLDADPSIRWQVLRDLIDTPAQGESMGKIALRYCAFGEFKVLVDGATVIDGGALAALGVLPSGRKVVDVVRARLSGCEAPAPRCARGER